MHHPVSRVAIAATLFIGAFVYAQDQAAGPRPDQPAAMAPFVHESLLLDGTSADGIMVVVGEHGHIIVSNDAGKSWVQAPAPTRSMLTGVYFSDATNGWAVGHDAVILKTADGGKSWQKKHYAPKGQTPLLDVWFAADGQRGIAVGAYGLYLSSADGGETWEQRPFISKPPPAAMDEDEAQDGDAADIDAEEEGADDEFVDEEFGEDFHLNHITAAADGTLYIAAEAGHFYRSDDDGEIWYSLPTIYAGSYFATIPLSGDELLLVGMRGNAFRSRARGLDLQPVDVKTEALLTSGYATPQGGVVVAGLAGVVLTSGDNGKTFTLHGQEDRKGNMAVLAAGNDALVLIGEAGVKRLSKDQYTSGGND